MTTYYDKARWGILIQEVPREEPKPAKVRADAASEEAKVACDRYSEALEEIDLMEPDDYVYWERVVDCGPLYGAARRACATPAQFNRLMEIRGYPEDNRARQAVENPF